MNNNQKNSYKVLIKEDTIVVKRGNHKLYLPPTKKVNRKSHPRTDFNLFGKAIINNLGYSELLGEIKKIRGNK